MAKFEPLADLYGALLALPDTLTGEIINGQIYTHPRPGGKHVLVASNLGVEIGGPYHRGRGGPGGWWILQEPEVHLALDREVVVPDLAGWRKQHLPAIPDSHKFTVVPDWICEILSPSTRGVDRDVKMPLYARYGVGNLWLVSPEEQLLEAFRLVNGQWDLQGRFQANDRVAVEPFELSGFCVKDLFA